MAWTKLTKRRPSPAAACVLAACNFLHAVFRHLWFLRGRLVCRSRRRGGFARRGVLVEGRGRVVKGDLVTHLLGERRRRLGFVGQQILRVELIAQLVAEDAK